MNKGFILTTKQMELYNSIVNNKEVIMPLGVGVGKTTVLCKIIEDFDFLPDIVNNYLTDEKTVKIVRELLSNLKEKGE